MKLASLKEGGRDGTLVVVSRDLAWCRDADGIAPTLQAALDDWERTAPRLRNIYESLNAGERSETRPFDVLRCHSPLPRAYQWLDGSGYINHIELVRKARGADMPPSAYADPIVYQGGSDSFLGPRGVIRGDESWGIDFEAEVAVIMGDVRQGASREEAAREIRLLMLVNDVSLRNLIPPELAKGFGFVISKPASAFSPVAITPDELGDAWRDNKIHLPLLVHVNGKLFGKPNAGVDVTFDFSHIVAHVASTRELEAGSIVGSGTVSNKQGGLWGSAIDNGGVGYCCIAELRMLETLEGGQALTSYLRHGDVVRIEMLDGAGRSLFGAIEQRVRALEI
ncbi:fumarylacetoacetate hydrolase family protein [Noviherbaspirillum sedimenti]|uniref:FAA hydrolase family protein n=1 Tax=Noviherbaspirillum sedimenti TaxID=2320865 RepID=A0A3A3G6D1_9BURK|nr:fumarylacetoacetate hydrolase family protein [Noviherbaspirillum sedimenti]RJG03491.1 FAA hydrolase family protein [Noviherbaspirillum sedimenti]